jgi:hypothetical protein
MERFFYEDVLKQKVDFFNNFRLRQRKQVLTWVRWSSVLFFSLVIFLLCVQFVMASLYSSLQQEESDLLVKVEKVHLKSKSLLIYRQQNVKLLALQLSLKNNEQYRGKIINLFRVIAGLIPSNTRLAHLSVNDSSVNLKGVSTKLYELNEFYKKFSGLPIVKDCKLTQSVSENQILFKISSSLA